MKQEIKFIYESKYTSNFAGHCGTPRRVEHTIDSEVSLSELLEQFEYFIKAIGYFPPDNSKLEYVKNDEFSGSIEDLFDKTPVLPDDNI